ncbi:MAG: hypothetical protein ABI647_08390 [Gemmatimonadota bacterium]
MTLDPRTPVVVLRIHHGSLGIARSLGRLGVPVYAVNAALDTPALRSRYWRHAFKWDFLKASPAESIEFLIRLAKEVGGKAVLIPTADDLAELVSEHADALRPYYAFQDNRPELVRSLSQKRELYALALRHGIPTATTEFPQSYEEVRRFAVDATFPIMLKANDGLRMLARTGTKMVIVRSAEELLAEYLRLEDPANPDLMLQEYIPGGDDTIWMFNGYFDRDSICRFGITGKKLRQFPIHRGATSLGICLENDTVRELTERFMKAIGYRGILDIGFRYDARDGGYKLLDPNPRVGMTFRLFVSHEGWDTVRFLYADLTGQALPAATAVEGRKWIVEDWDIDSCLEYRREDLLGIGEWIGSLAGVEEGAWFAWDDPRPALAVAGAMASRFRSAIGRGWGRNGARPAAV